jgi:glucose/mannose transport system substrate-binding protein
MIGGPEIPPTRKSDITNNKDCSVFALKRSAGLGRSPREIKENLMKRMRTTFLGLVMLGSSLPACGSAENVATTDQTLEVFNWWTNPGESDAAAALLSLYSSKYPKTTVINSAVATLSKAQSELNGRMVGGTPPDTFQTLGGWNMWQWVAYNGQNDADSKMEPIDFIATAHNLAAVVPRSVLDVVSYNGKIYGIPLGVHRFNSLFYNKKLFDDNGLTPPVTLPDFYAVSETFKAKGIIPLAVGSKDGHQVSIVTWDGLLVAKGGVEFRESYFAGGEDPSDSRIVETLNEYAHMLDYSNTDRDALTWNGAAQMVVDNKAAMTIVGDFGKGFFLSKGWHSGVELGEVPVPGTSGVFVYIVDSFGLPKGITDRQATVNFLNMVATAEAQNVFNPIKGAAPPRTDVDKAPYDQIARSTIDDLANNTLTRAAAEIVKNPAFLTAVDEAMRQFAVDRNVDTVLNVLRNRYDQL